MFCTNCGKPVEASMRFCAQCGRRVAPSGDNTVATPNVPPGHVDNKWARMGVGKCAVGAVLIMFELLTPNFGLWALDSYQALGADIFAIVLYGFSAGLIYYGIRPVFQE